MTFVLSICAHLQNVIHIEHLGDDLNIEQLCVSEVLEVVGETKEAKEACWVNHFPDKASEEAETIECHQTRKKKKKK